MPSLKTLESVSQQAGGDEQLLNLPLRSWVQLSCLQGVSVLPAPRAEASFQRIPIMPQGMLSGAGDTGAGSSKEAQQLAMSQDHSTNMRLMASLNQVGGCCSDVASLQLGQDAVDLASDTLLKVAR